MDVILKRAPQCLAVVGTMALVLIVGAISADAQEFRGGVSGRVTDESGGVLPGAVVTALSKDTNVPASATSNESGHYTILYLTPGLYTVTAELPGFKKVVRDGVEVRVGDRLELDFKMNVGGLEETVQVTAETPLLQTTNASAGQVIDAKRISMLPLSDGNPFVLSRLAPGIAYTGDLKFSRPFDNAGTSAIVADGAPGGNEFTLDGSPNMASGRRVAFVPPAGAVQEFKVETASFDAQQGHTAGATVNVKLKSGTNALKGEGYYFLRDEKLSANDFFLHKAGRPKDALGYDRFGGHAGGPVRVPGLYNGRDRSFFFGAVEWLYDEFPEPGQFTVPTDAQRRGDFSALLPLGIVVYDPRTAVRRADGRIEREPFPGNVIPAGRLSPIAQEYLKYYPAPNQSGDAQGRNNFISGNQRTDDFYSISTRFDHQITDKQKVFVRYTRNNRREARGNWTGVVNGIRPTGNFLFRINDGVTLDHVWTMAASTLLNLRGGWQRFQEPNIRQHQGEFDPAKLGFAAGATRFFGGASYLPRFEIGGMSVLGDSVGGGNIHSIYSFQPTLTRIVGNHSLRAGYDFRAYREYTFGVGHAAGRYDFGTNFTRQLDNSPSAPIGQELASFMLGLPTGGFIDRNAERYNQTLYNGVFFQDDWRIGNRLTVNLGLRYEYEGATTERENRNVRGFDPNAAIGVAAAARAAYAGNPIPEVPLSGFRVQGGVRFAGDGGRGFWDTDRNNFQPRLGAAYRLSDKMVLRAGWAIYTVPAIISGVFQPGFSQATQIVPTLDNGLSFRATLANPFPDGVADPPGASLGPDTFVGRSLSRFNANTGGTRNPQSTRWAVSVQRELPGQWVVEAGYVGNRGYDLETDLDLNPVPRQYLSTSAVRDEATINFLTTNVPNPFRGLLPGTGLDGTTTGRQQLLRPYPHFTDVPSRAYDGTSKYHGAQFRVERRFHGGYTLLTSYTYSRFTEKTFRLNPTDPGYEERLSDADLPHRVVTSAIWELPFGRGRRFAGGAGRALDALIGGWSLTAIWQAQNGRPISFHDRNIYFNGDRKALKTKFSRDTNLPVFDVSGFYFHDDAVKTNGVDDPNKQRNDTRIQLASNIRTFPSRFDGLRGDPLNLWDASIVKRVRFSDRIAAQFHVEFLNAFNTVVFNNPDTNPRNSTFGKVTSTNNLPRNVQLAAKIIF